MWVLLLMGTQPEHSTVDAEFAPFMTLHPTHLQS